MLRRAYQQIQQFNRLFGLVQNRQVGYPLVLITFTVSSICPSSVVLR
jgi:hypothetical protein